LALIVYVTVPGERHPEDALDLRFLEASEGHTLVGVATDEEGLYALLAEADAPVNLVVVAGYGAVEAVLSADRTTFRKKVARLFLVGGSVGAFLPIDPRLSERHPERFAVPEPRLSEPEAFSRLLTSGEAVIWLPRDICLWRCDVMDLTDGPVLLSALPAFLLASRPEPLLWLRLFRTIPARVEVDLGGRVTLFDTKASPNLHAIVAIDGAALTKELVRALASQER
jgi:hypothetical protein